jgi:dienelactone hydrolase
MVRHLRAAAAALVVITAGPLSAQAPVPGAREQAGQAFVSLLAKRDFAGAEAMLDSTMRKALPAAKLGEVWASLEAQAGPFRSQGTTTVRRVGAYDLVTIPGAFTRAALDFQVAFNAAGQVSGFHVAPPASAWAPPPYVKPGSLRSEEVTIGAGPLALGATLTLPAGAGPFPALVLVHGSGPNDRDESVGGVKVFRDLAEGLASSGIAVLRYEKRTRAHPEAFMGRFTVDDETVDDALAAAALLRSRPDIDRARVFVLGHSLGGMMAPRIGARDPGLAGLVILAGSTRPLEEAMLDQVRWLSAHAGADSAQAAAQLAPIKAAAERVRALTAADSLSTERVMGAPTSYWMDLRSYRPAEVARSLRMPLLILQGERDYQVTMADFAGWRATLDGRAGVTFRTYPALNHLFVAGQGPSLPAEYAAPNHVAAEVVMDIARWIRAAGPAPRP